MSSGDELKDILDRAAHTAQVMNDEAVANVRHRCRPEQVQNQDGTWPHDNCVDCDADLGERKKLGYIRCVECQSVIERRGKQYALR